MDSFSANFQPTNPPMDICATEAGILHLVRRSIINATIIEKKQDSGKEEKWAIEATVFAVPEPFKRAPNNKKIPVKRVANFKDRIPVPTAEPKTLLKLLRPKAQARNSPPKRKKPVIIMYVLLS